MWVGENFYKTPESFVLEARKMGICKAIPTIPSRLKLGKSWIVLAHRKVVFPIHKEGRVESQKLPGIFYAFRPTRIEMLIWKSQATKEYLEKLRKQGITPVVVPDEDKVHSLETDLWGKPRRRKLRKKK